MHHLRHHVWLRRLGLAGALLALAACADSGIGPDDQGVLPAYADDVSLLSLENEVEGGAAARVEIALYEEGLVAREVVIKSGDALGRPERIHGRITDLQVTDAGAFLVLNIDGLRVHFNRETGIWAQGSEDPLDIETFIARLRSALADGTRPAVVAFRAPRDLPQDPGNAEFVAAKLKVGGEGEGRIIALNIDADNLVRNESPPPDGWAAVLGLRIELRVSEGLTHIKRERPDVEIKRFEGVVRSVDLENRSFVINEGLIVYVVPETDIKYEEGDEHRLASLEQVARALEAGLTVVSAGAGVVRGTEPLRLVAIAVVFELAPPPMREFEGVVQSVNLTDSTVSLGDLTVRIDAETEIRFDATNVHTLGSLEDVARALAEGKTVVAHGVGVVEDDAERVILARKIAFVLRPPPVVEFRGQVTAVDLTDSTVTIAEGPIVRITDKTEILFESGDAERLGSLEDVADALAAGERVFAAGFGELAPTPTAVSDRPVIVACKIVFFLEPPGVTAFHGVVRSVQLDAGTFMLVDGTVVLMDEGTDVWFPTNDDQWLGSLEAVAEAVDAGQTVVAAGVGVIEATDPLKLRARRVAFLAVPPGVQYFEGTVVEVDLGNRSVTLDVGATVRIVEGTTIVHESGGETLGSLEAVAEVVADGGSVTAAGMGLLETSDPLVFAAITVVFRL